MVEKKTIPGVNEGDSVISYTQFSMYQNCPKSWELAYARKLRTKEPSISLVFGTSMHETIQNWLGDVYRRTPNSVNLNDELQRNMELVFAETVEQWGSAFSSLDEIEEHYDDGVNILVHLKRQREEFYNPDDTVLYGIEYPLLVVPVEEKPTVKFIAYLDVVLSKLDSTGFIIDDLKTSTNGWSDYQKKDRTKISQLLLYKYYFAKSRGVNPQDVMARYIVLCRKSKNKIQLFIPKQTNPAMKSVIDELKAFVNTVFDDDGKVRLDIDYPAVTGYGYEKCKFCEFRNKHDLCPVESRIADIEMLNQ